MAPRITPRTLKGFRDHLPADMAPRRAMIRIIERVFEAHGFGPLDTPALEYAEILTGKYGDEGDKLLYRFEDHGGRRVALRYDLTVPLARVVAQHGGRLIMPLRRYHIAPVWRADKPQRGRFREFMQCDVDIVGSPSSMADAGILIAGLAALRALGIEGARLHLNHRDVLRAILERAGVPGGKASVLALRAVDKWDKVGPGGVRRELARVEDLSPAAADALMEAFSRAGAGDGEGGLERLAALAGDSPALARLRRVEELVGAAGLGDMLRIDATIARGLDYYTGVIYETRLTDPRVASIGAVMSGGRYDELIGIFGKQRVPATGISLGLDRLLAALRELGLVEAAGGALVHVTVFTPALEAASLRAATALRAAGLSVEVSTEGGKLGKQLARADRRGCRFAVVIGPDEDDQGLTRCKDLRSGEQHTVPLAELPALIQALATDGAASAEIDP